MRPQAAAMKVLLNQPGIQIMPGCGDGMGARLIAMARPSELATAIRSADYLARHARWPDPK
jgi:hypothetical protein